MTHPGRKVARSGLLVHDLASAGDAEPLFRCFMGFLLWHFRGREDEEKRAKHAL